MPHCRRKGTGRYCLSWPRVPRILLPTTAKHQQNRSSCMSLHQLWVTLRKGLATTGTKSKQHPGQAVPPLTLSGPSVSPLPLPVSRAVPCATHPLLNLIPDCVGFGNKGTKSQTDSALDQAIKDMMLHPQMSRQTGGIEVVAM